MGRDEVERRAEQTRAFFRHVPLNQAMGMEVVEVGEGWATMRLPWDDRWWADRAAGRVHGGVPAALLDATCGMAAFMGLAEPSVVATLDLRLDHLGELEGGRPLEAEARVVGRAAGILFVRGQAHHRSEHPLVVATATFAVTP